MKLSSEIIEQVAVLLGRAPRGLEDIPVTGPAGEPMVIRVSSLVDEKPFPTLFWLVDSSLCYRIDKAEAGGLIKQLQARVDNDEQLQERMANDHRAYITLRDSFMSEQVRQRLLDLGFGDALAAKGVGGIADFSRIRCLHTWYGAHLVLPNTVGELLDNWWREQAS